MPRHVMQRATLGFELYDQMSDSHILFDFNELESSHTPRTHKMIDYLYFFRFMH